MTIFFRLLTAHLLVDFIIFRERVYELRQCDEKYALGHALHVGVYVLAIIILCWPFMGMTWADLGAFKINGWLMLAPLVLIHLAADRFDRSSTAAGAPGYNTIYFFARQLISISALFLIAPAAPYMALTFFDKALLVLSGGVFVTYFLMMMLHHIDNDLNVQEFPTPDERYAEMLYRAVLYLLLLLPGYMGWGLGILWLVFVASTKNAHGFDASAIKIYIGTPLTILAALLIRMLVLYA